MFKRQTVTHITHWYQQKQRKPLVIRGARQVGKTTAVRMAAEQLEIPLVEINLERHPELDKLFREYRLDELLFNFSLITGQSVTKDKPLLLFLDEAQATPAAYSCLRYFYEDMPELAVILTGSLLDQVLNNYQLPSPVGRIESYFMGAMNFEEFLEATQQTRLSNALTMLTAENMHQIPDSVHEDFLAQVRRYTLTGGMPYCIQIGLDTGFEHQAILKYQTTLIQSYKDDFAKYQGTQDALTLNAFFNGIIGQTGQQFSHKLANAIAVQTSGSSRQLNTAIEHFIAARLFYRVLHSNADAVPLGADTKIRISKFLFIDIGLLLAAQGIPAQSLMHSALELTNRGLLAEQFVGQQLLHAKPAYVNPELYYWQPPRSEMQAEVDYIYTHQNEIIPVEVKSGSKGTIKSLQSFVIRKQSRRVIRISSAKPLREHLTAKMKEQTHEFELLNVPFYLVNRLEQLLAE